MILEYRHYGFYCRGTISTADARQAIERAKIGSRGGQRVLYVRTKNILLPLELLVAFWTVSTDCWDNFVIVLVLHNCSLWLAETFRATFFEIKGCVPLRWSGSGSVIRDHSDHGRLNDPMNPLLTRIQRFIWSTILIQIISKERTLNWCVWAKQTCWRSKQIIIVVFENLSDKRFFRVRFCCL